MKPSIVVIAAAIGICFCGMCFCTGAQAQNYPWCAHYGEDMDGTNCGFTSFQQCMVTLSGMGGFCEQNTQYVPPPGPHPALNPHPKKKN
jgi:hypothetical protein